MNSYELLWTVMHSYEQLWTVMNSYEILWTVMNSYEQFWTVMNSYDHSTKLGKTFPVAGRVGGEKLGIRLISASWSLGLAELGNSFIYTQTLIFIYTNMEPINLSIFFSILKSGKGTFGAKGDQFWPKSL